MRSLRSGHSDKPVLAAAGKSSDTERASSYVPAGSPTKTKSSKDLGCDCDSDQPDSMSPCIVVSSVLGIV